MKRIIDEFNKKDNHDNILVPEDNDDTDKFEKDHGLDCRKKTNYDKILLKSPCFKGILIINFFY